MNGKATCAACAIGVQPERLMRNLLVFCVASEVLLALADGLITYGGWIALFPIRELCDMSVENGLATWFQVMQTFLAGITLWAIFLLAGQRGVPRASRTGWAVLAAFFTYMAVDDGAMIHERLGTAFELATKHGGGAVNIFPSYPWQVLFMPIFGALGLFMMVFLWRTMRGRGERFRLCLAVALMGLAVVLDFIEGLDDEHRWNLYTWISIRFGLDYRTDYTVWHFASLTEEFLEMLSISLLWVNFTYYLARQLGQGVRLFTANGGTSASPALTGSHDIANHDNGR